MITGGGSGGGSSTPAFAFGTAAAQPAASASNAGTAYYRTDTGEVTFSNGSSWLTIQGLNTLNGLTTTIGGGTGGGHLLLDGATFSSDAVNLKLATLSLHVITAGAGLGVAEGSNAKQGTATLVAGTVTVPNTSVTATSRIFLTIQSPGGAVGSPYVSARTAGTSFTITSTSATDTSVVAYEIFEVG